jgi:hypothetical protein
MNYKDSRRIPGWRSGTSRKSPGWEKAHLTNFLDSRIIPGWGRGTSWKGPVCDKVHQINTQISMKNSGLATGFIQTTEGNCIPGQGKFDH